MFSIFGLVWSAIAFTVAWGLHSTFYFIDLSPLHILVIPVLIILYFAILRKFWNAEKKIILKSHILFGLALWVFRVLSIQIFGGGWEQYEYRRDGQIIFDIEPASLLGVATDAVIACVALICLAAGGWVWVQLREFLYLAIKKICAPSPPLQFFQRYFRVDPLGR